MADNSAPMVVGMRHTSSATSTTVDCSAPAYTANGCSVAVAARNTMVNPASRMFRAISLGVFARVAPSTRAIIRSMKLSPGLAVTCTTIRSDSTFVPPVTELRSPPDSRITGADSPVMADSSTLATPSTTSPSPGMTCPAVTTTRSPTRSWVAGTASSCSPAPSRYAVVSVLARRRVAAWALPRPSATASERLAKMTVSHSQATTAHAKTLGCITAETVENTAPTSTTNITGLRIMTRGSSLTNASGREVSSSFGSSTPADIRAGAAVVGVVMTGLPRADPGRERGRRSGRRRSPRPR